MSALDGLFQSLQNANCECMALEEDRACEVCRLIAIVKRQGEYIKTVGCSRPQKDIDLRGPCRATDPCGNCERYFEMEADCDLIAKGAAG